jgi:hypothetical protein
VHGQFSEQLLREADVNSPVSSPSLLASWWLLQALMLALAAAFMWHTLCG